MDASDLKAGMPVVVGVPMELIDASPYQKRRVFRHMDELAANIGAVGLLEPVTVRPAGERYQLVFGERRKRACETLGLATMPAFVRGMTDEEAAIASATENLQSESLEPIEEAESIEILHGLGWTFEQIAEKIGHSAPWVARLASLTRLSPKWLKLVGNEKEAVSTWSAIHLAKIARFPVDVQDDLAKSFSGGGEWRQREVFGMTTRQLERELGDDLRALSAAPWKKDDAELVPAAGSCAACTKRSDCEPLLFQNNDEEDGEKKKTRGAPAARCLDMACWEKKAAAHMKVVEAQLRAEHGNVVKLSTHYAAGKDTDTVNEWTVEKAKKGDTGAVPALVIDGNDAGQVRWIKPRKDTESGKRAATKLKPKTLAERQRDYDWRRLRSIVVDLAAEFEHLYGCKNEKKVPAHLTERDLLVFAHVFGTREKASSFRACFQKPNGFKVYGMLQKNADANLPEMLFRQACGVIESILRNMGNLAFSMIDAGTQKKNLADVQACVEILGLKWDLLWEEAAATIPYPKSWTRLKADGTPRGDKASAKGKATAKVKPKAKAEVKKPKKPHMDELPEFAAEEKEKNP